MATVVAIITTIGQRILMKCCIAGWGLNLMAENLLHHPNSQITMLLPLLNDLENINRQARIGQAPFALQTAPSCGGYGLPANNVLLGFPTTPHLKWHFDRFSRFCRVHNRDQQTGTHLATCVAKARIYARHVMQVIVIIITRKTSLEVTPTTSATFSVGRECQLDVTYLKFSVQVYFSAVVSHQLQLSSFSSCDWELWRTTFKYDLCRGRGEPAGQISS